MNPEQIIKQKILTVASNVMENAYLNGNGVGKPLGMFVASDVGISTDRDVTGGSSTGLQADDFATVEGALKQQYRKNAAWLVSRSFMEKASKLKAGDGNYILNPNQRVDGFQTILGYPCLSPSMFRAVWTSKSYVGIFGDFSKYFIIDNLDMQIQRLNELFALTSQVGYIFRYSGDGNVSDENAFVRLKLK